MTDIVRLWDRQPERFNHEFDCKGCGRSVIAFVHRGHPDFCFMCQELGPELSKALQDRGESVPPV
jgi:hypothetical protein